MSDRPEDHRRQMSVLTLLFFQKLFSSELLAVEEQAREKLFVALAGLGAGAGFVAYVMLRKYFWLPDASGAWLDESTFISLVMCAMALVAVLVWESLFVDRADMANLGALPVRSSTLVAAKLIGLVAFATGCAASMAVPSAALFAGFLSRFHGEDLEWGIRQVVAHAVAVTAAGLATFLACAVLQGLLVLGIGAQRYRRRSLFLRTALVVGVLLLLAQIGPLHTALAFARLGDSDTVLVFPPMWFVGLEETIAGTGAHELREAALVGCGVLAALAGLAPVLVLAGMRRVSHLGEPAERHTTCASRLGRSSRALGDLIFGSARERGMAAFCGACLWRSARHRLLVVTMLALGLGMMLPWVLEAIVGEHPARLGGALMAMPHVLCFLLVVAVRWAVATPAAPEAAWVFRTVPLGDRRALLDATRKAAALRVLLPVVACLVPFYALLWGVVPALLHGVFALSAATVLAELVLARFQFVPFASPAAGGMGNLKATWAAYVVALAVYASTLALLETRFLLQWPFWLLWAVAVAAGLWLAAELRRDTAARSRPATLDDDPEPNFVVLGLDA
jgi:hypothetical protein